MNSVFNDENEDGRIIIIHNFLAGYEAKKTKVFPRSFFF